MNTEKKYRGIVIPAVTPLTQEHRLDHEAIEKMFIHFYKCNASPFILGTTGESASLSMALKKQYIKKAQSLKQNDTLLYAGISSNCFEESVELAEFCFNTGVDAVAATLPAYYAMTVSQMKKYFEQLADAVRGPLIIYNIPATIHMSIPLELIDELSHHENIVATKDSERSDERLQQSLALWSHRNDFSHFLGWAARSAVALIGGSDGLIPSTGNLDAKLYEDMFNAIKANDHDTAFQLQHRSDELGNLYQQGRTLGESLSALKILMAKENLCKEFVMPPLQSLPEKDKNNIINQYKELLNG
ncbi:MAG: dihydrodipicolinate synthase family protein [Ferruginibacter sp.]